MNEGLAGLERHKGETTEFYFLVIYPFKNNPLFNISTLSFGNSSPTNNNYLHLHVCI